MTPTTKRKKRRLVIPVFTPKTPLWLKRTREGLSRPQSADDVIEGMIKKGQK